MIGGLATADPSTRVAKWWRDKADEIYARIPDFGGFVVKANSEGQPGPYDYHRTHRGRANVLADAVRPHGGIVMYRAFVYDADVDPDRVKRAYKEFVPLDGRFRDKCSCRSRTAPSTSSRASPSIRSTAPSRARRSWRTADHAGVLGQATHLVYLAPMWKSSSTRTPTPRGRDPRCRRSWTARWRTHPDRDRGRGQLGQRHELAGHDFAQANWYAYGRLAWDPSLTAEDIADEWIRMTLVERQGRRGSDRDLMMRSARPSWTIRCRSDCTTSSAATTTRPCRRTPTAPRGLVRVVLSPCGLDRHRLRPHTHGQRCRLPVPLALAEHGRIRHRPENSFSVPSRPVGSAPALGATLGTSW